MFLICLTTPVMSKRWGRTTCLRLKSRSCCVRAAALAADLDLLDIGPVGVVGLQILQQEGTVAQNSRQHVVEVVGDASREPADRLHFLRLAQLRLGLVALRQVVMRGDVMADAARRFAHGRDGQRGVV